MINFNDHALLLNESHRRWTGEYLVAERDPGEVLAALNEADMVIVSYGLEREPVFNYGNVKALSMLGYQLENFIQLAHKITIPEQETLISLELSQKVEQQGYIENYSGHRLAKNGRLWRVESGVCWQLSDNLGRVHGHAACFQDWHQLS